MADTNTAAPEVKVCRTVTELEVIAAQQGVTLTKLDVAMTLKLISFQESKGVTIPDWVKKDGNTIVIITLPPHQESPLVFVLVFGKDGCFLNKGQMPVGFFNEFLKTNA